MVVEDSKGGLGEFGVYKVQYVLAIFIEVKVRLDVLLSMGINTCFGLDNKKKAPYLIRCSVMQRREFYLKITVEGLKRNREYSLANFHLS